MPIFKLHSYSGTDFIEDREGQEYPGQASARAAAIKGLRDVAATEVQDGRLNSASYIEIVNEAGDHLVTVHFSEAVTVSRTRTRDPR